jgi:AraC-like DNA-binding protein
LLDLDNITISTSTHPPLRVHRTARLIRHDPQTVQVAFPVRGRLGLRTADRQVTLRPPDFAVCSASQPFEAQMYAGRDGIESIVLGVPAARLPLRANLVDRLVAMPLSGDAGIGAVLRVYVVGLAGQLREYRPSDAARLAIVTLDLLGAVFAHHLDTQDATVPNTHQRVLRARIDDFIRRHLADPDLCPDLIATQHQISLRYLYKLFQGDKLSVAATIRRRRLEGCRLDLAAPGMRMRSIQAISANWGFTDAVQFSHAFRHTYGVSPSDYRNQAGETAGDLASRSV